MPNVEIEFMGPAARSDDQLFLHHLRTPRSVRAFSLDHHPRQRWS
jgi:hypothetical protein